MAAFMATVTYTAIVFGDDEDEARKTAPDVVRALCPYPVCIDVESLEESPAPGTSPGPTNAGSQ